MAVFVKGDVVVLPFPFADLSGSKRRPALVLADLPGDDILLYQFLHSVQKINLLYRSILLILVTDRCRLILSFVPPNFHGRWLNCHSQSGNN